MASRGKLETRPLKCGARRIPEAGLAREGGGAQARRPLQCPPAAWAAFNASGIAHLAECSPPRPGGGMGALRIRGCVGVASSRRAPWTGRRQPDLC